MKAAVLGSPIAHSLSPALHRAAYHALGLDGWQYTAHQVDAAGLSAFIDGLDDTWAGISLTMPLKQAVIGLLDATDDLVAVTGSCNTVVMAERKGYNTDVHGIVAALAGDGVTATSRPVILGGGATAASAVAAVSRLGATFVTVAVRDPGRADAPVNTCRLLGVSYDVRPLHQDTLREADLVVSTLPARAADLLAPGLGAVGASLLDVVYDPWPTALAAAWRFGGGRVVPGHDMLLHQAVCQVGLITGLAGPVEAMRSGLSAERLRRAGAAMATKGVRPG